MKITNVNHSPDVGACLATFGELLKANGIEFTDNREKSEAKGEGIILEILIGVGSNMIWDLLKAAVARHKDLIRGDPKIAIGEKQYDIKGLPLEPPP